MKRTHVVSVLAGMLAILIAGSGMTHTSARTPALAGGPQTSPLRERRIVAHHVSRQARKTPARPAVRRAPIRRRTTATRSTAVAPVVHAPTLAYASDAESRLTALANQARRSGGLSSCAWNTSLASYARSHSAAMARSGTIYHSSQSQLWAALDRACSSCNYVGEVIAMGRTVDEVQQKFMSSSGHRATIMDGNYHIIGTGVVFANGWYWVTEVYGG